MNLASGLAFAPAFESCPLFLQTVAVNMMLVRKRRQTRTGSERYWDVEVPEASLRAAEPLVGVVVGVRTLSDGLLVWGDEGPHYKPKMAFKALMVVTDPHRAPIYVLESDVSPML